jgi:hypothetical protein
MSLNGGCVLCVGCAKTHCCFEATRPAVRAPTEERTRQRTVFGLPSCKRVWSAVAVQAPAAADAVAPTSGQLRMEPANTSRHHAVTGSATGSAAVCSSCCCPGAQL